MSRDSGWTRRRFVQSALAASAAPALAGVFSTSPRNARTRRKGATERVNIAGIGVGGGWHAFAVLSVSMHAKRCSVCIEAAVDS